MADADSKHNNSTNVKIK